MSRRTREIALRGAAVDRLKVWLLPDLNPAAVASWVCACTYSLLAATTLRKMPDRGVLMLPTLALELFAAVSFMIRAPAQASDPTGRARMTAYGGTLFVLVFLLFANTYYPHWLNPTGSNAARMAGIMLWLAGSAWAAYSVWYLRLAFSIEPEAPRLISSGPYDVARHPVYLGYFAQYLGVWLLFPHCSSGRASLSGCC